MSPLPAALAEHRLDGPAFAWFWQGVGSILRAVSLLFLLLYTACASGKKQTSAQKNCEGMFGQLVLSSYVGFSEASHLLADAKDFPEGARKDFVSLISFALRIYKPTHDIDWDFQKMVAQPVERIADCAAKKDAILKSAVWMFIRWGGDLMMQKDRIADPTNLFRQADAWLGPLESKYPNDEWLPQLRHQLVEAAGPGFR